MTDAQLQYIVAVNDRDLQDLQKRIRETNKLLGQGTAKAAAEGSKGFEGFGGKAQLLAGGVLVGVAKGAQSAAQRASELGEQLNKSSAIFGLSAKTIEAWSETTARGLGISQVAALEATGQFGNMLVPLGIAPKRAGELSRGLVQAAADMASFNDASPEETLAALASGLAGETEPLRRFGIRLSSARIAAEALAMGLGKTKQPSLEARQALLGLESATAKHAAAVKEHGKGSLEARQAALAMEAAQERVRKTAAGSAGSLSDAAKAQATYALVQRDMLKSGATGDLAKTATSYANAQRIQKAVQDDLIVSTGQGLLPVQTAANKVVGEATKLLFANQTAGTAAVGVVASLAAGVFLVNGAIKVKAASIVVATAATKAWAAAQRVLNVVLRANPIGLVITALALLAGGLVVAYDKSETFRSIVKAALDAVSAAGRKLRDVFGWFRDHAGEIWSAVELALTPHIAVIKKLLTGVSAGADLVKDGFVWVRDNAGKIWESVSTAAAKPLGLISDAIGLVGDGLGRVKDAFEWIAGNASSLAKKLEPLTSILGKVGGVLGKIPGVGDVAAGFNSAAAAAARARLPGVPPATGLAPQTSSLLRTIQTLFGGVTLSSGHRTAAENARVGGAPNSDHLTGRAIDLVPAGGWTLGGIAHLDRIAAWAAALPQVRWVGWRGVPGHGPYDHLHLSTFARGGIVHGAMLGDTGIHARRREAVLPLESAHGRRILASSLSDALNGRQASPVIEFSGDVHVRNDYDLAELSARVWRELASR